jgi:hypothetical protein
VQGFNFDGFDFEFDFLLEDLVAAPDGVCERPTRDAFHFLSSQIADFIGCVLFHVTSLLEDRGRTIPPSTRRLLAQGPCRWREEAHTFLVTPITVCRFCCLKAGMKGLGGTASARGEPNDGHGKNGQWPAELLKHPLQRKCVGAYTF